MPFGDVPTVFSSTDASGATFVDPSKADIEGGGSATVALSSGDPSSEVITFQVAPADVFDACPGLTSASQITSVSLRFRLSTDNGQVSITAIAPTGIIGYGFGVHDGAFAYVNVDISGALAHDSGMGIVNLFDPLFAASPVDVGGALTSTPAVGSNNISWDATLLRLTYNVGGNMDDIEQFIEIYGKVKK